jgi:tungstate transport system substrate-binding protein
MRFKRATLEILILVIFMLATLVGCSQEENPDSTGDNNQEAKELKLATTTSTEDSGLLDYLLPEFKKDTGYTVKVIAVGTGQAIEMGEAGDVDVILVHAREAEDKFVADGFGVDRRDVMYNDFLVIGPAEDPAGIKGSNDVKAAFNTIAEKQATFIFQGRQFRNS